MSHSHRPEFTSRGIARIFRWTLYPSLLPAVACSVLFLAIVIHDFGPLTSSQEMDVVIFTVGIILTLSLLSALLAAGADTLSLGRVPWTGWQGYWLGCAMYFMIPLASLAGLLLWRASQGGLDQMLFGIVQSEALVSLLFLGTIGLWSLTMFVLALVGLFSNEQATLDPAAARDWEGQT